LIVNKNNISIIKKICGSLWKHGSCNLKVEQDCEIHVGKNKSKTTRCVEINGIPSTMITKRFLITTKVWAITPPTRSMTRGSG
jgi:hypothetical protein